MVLDRGCSEGVLFLKGLYGDKQEEFACEDLSEFVVLVTSSNWQLAVALLTVIAGCWNVDSSSLVSLGEVVLFFVYSKLWKHLVCNLEAAV